ncbi:site-2 protease family protein [Candidatus Woesebacteria bacterium]|nr:site-2 protease family protein [Candidatus Woesebacteria bacterium]
MLTAITFFIILVILVLIHEFGHFIAAKKSGVYVEEFGFGFPPRLIGKKIGETLYSFNLLPLGGFVRLFGEEYHEEGKKKETEIPSHRAFINKKPWQKAIIIGAGVVMNFILGWALISYLFTVGTPVPAGISIEQVQKGSPAATAGLKKGDKLEKIKVNGSEIMLKTTPDLVNAAKKYGDQEVDLYISRGGATNAIKITPRSKPPEGQGSLGIVINQLVETKKYPWYTAPFYGLIEAATMTKTILVELLKIPLQFFTAQKTNVEFSGPVGIAKIVGEARKYGINALLEITALLSLNLAVVNILPFPALDGGRMIFVFYEWITRKKPNQDLEKYLNLAGIIILLSLSALITIWDIQKLWG